MVRTGLMLIDGLLGLLLLIRLVMWKRDIDSYRPPSPIRPFRASPPGLTITRWT